MNEQFNWRPYFAVVWDSFHSALSSRVLWAAMLAIWIVLACLAPIGVREDYTTTFRWFDVYNGTRMKAMLAQGMVDPAMEKAPLGRLADAMPDELSRKLKRVGEGDEVRINLPMFTDAFNDLIDQDAKFSRSLAGAAEADDSSDQGENADSHWYDAEAWESTVRLRELRDLDEQDASELSDSLLRRRARLRVEAALPGVFEARSVRSVMLTYGTLDFPAGFEIDRAQFESLFNQFVIPTLVNWLLGFVLVFLGILVTASIIPDMLQTGSLHLLLSKPVSRSALLIAKFVGGCAFVFLCVAQLVVGLYLISGIRLDVWNVRILWCIPVSVFMFAVFFSVSVLAGLKWRSPIISIAAAGALAAICVVTGVISSLFDGRIVQPDRIAGLVKAGDDLIAVTNGGGLSRMDAEKDEWVPLTDSNVNSRDRVLRPVAMDDDHILTARIRNGKFNPFGSGSLDLIVMGRDNDWKPQPGLRLPTSTERLITLDGDRADSVGRVMAVNTADLLIATNASILDSVGEGDLDANADKDDEPLNEENEDDSGDSRRRTRGPAPKSVASWLSGLMTMQGGATEDFVSILPRNVLMNPPIRLTLPLADTSAAKLILLNGTQLQRLESTDADDSQPWTRTGNLDLPRGDGSTPPVLAATESYILASTGDETLRVFDAKSFEPIHANAWPDELTPLSLHAITADRFVLVTTDGDGHVLRVVPDETESEPDDDGFVSTHSVELVSTLQVQDIETLAVVEDKATGETHFTVAHDVDRITHFDVSGEGDVTLVSRVEPQRSFWRRVDRYGIGFLETVTPQVLSLGDTTAGVVSGKQAFLIGGGDMETGEVIRYGIKGPLISCGAFIAIMLCISCVYFARTDF